jgi:hypothetical protein
VQREPQFPPKVESDDVWHVKCYFCENEAAMRRHLALTSFFALSFVINIPGIAATQESKQAGKQKKQPQAQPAALTGCVDQQEGQYVLISDQTRSLIAHLETEGFPTEGFAKHVGHKVTVRGTSSSTGAEHPTFKVRSVDAISDACGA